MRNSRVAATRRTDQRSKRRTAESALGAVMAIHNRARSGRGQMVDSAIYEAVLAVMECLVTEYDIGGYVRERTGSILPMIAPSNVYPTKDGKMVLIGANQDSVFGRLAEVADSRSGGDDGRFAQVADSHSGVRGGVIWRSPRPGSRG